MKRILQRIAALLLTAASMQGLAAAPAPPAALTPYTAEYDVITHGIRAGVAQFKLEQLAGDRYRFSSDSHTTGLVSLFRSDRIREASVFRVGSDGKVRALSYSYAHSGENDSQKITFDWTHHVAHSAYRGKSKDLKLASEAITDPFLAQIKLSLKVARGMTTGEFPVLNRNKFDTYHLQVKHVENVAVPAGKFETVRVERSDPGSSRKTVFWLAPALHYAPVKMEQFKEGDSVFRLELEKIGFGAKPSA